jgi:hypothetical protein
MNNLDKRFKTGGRKKGTPNKTTKELRELLTRLLSETMEEDVKGMTAIERTKLYRYILPPLMQEVNIDEQSERVIIHIDHNI